MISIKDMPRFRAGASYDERRVFEASRFGRSVRHGVPVYKQLSGSDFGMYQLTPVRVTTNDTVNTFVKSGDNSFPDMGWIKSTDGFYVYITDSFVMLTGMGSTQFCGFPVRVKRCINGTESDPGVTYFSVTKMSS